MSHDHPDASALVRDWPAAATALRAAALLPPDAVPWPWLREVAAARHPDLAADGRWDDLRGRLEALQLLTPGPAPEVARLDPQLAADLAATLTEAESAGLIAAIRDVVTVRMRGFKAARQALFREVVRGNAGPEAGEWYVAPLDEVTARAAALGSVEVHPLPDGSFALSLKGGLSWEEPCFRAFARQQLAAEDPDAIGWALRTGELTAADLEAARERIHALHARNPDGLAEGRLMGLYLLDVARADSARGFDRSAWSGADRAVALFEQLRRRHPEDTDVAALVEEARRARWEYDR